MEIKSNEKSDYLRYLEDNFTSDNDHFKETFDIAISDLKNQNNTMIKESVKYLQENLMSLKEENSNLTSIISSWMEETQKIISQQEVSNSKLRNDIGSSSTLLKLVLLTSVANLGAVLAFLYFIIFN